MSVTVVEEKKEKEKKPKSKARKIIEWVITAIFGVLIIGLAAVNISKWTNKDGYVFGNYLFPQVLSESMEPDYKVDEVIIVKKVDVDTLKVGDDITFYYKFPEFTSEVMCTHRIIEILPGDEGSGYKYTFVCQGINRESERWSDVKQYPHEDKVLGKVVGKSAFVGFLYKAFSSVWGLLVLILIPSLYLICSAIIDLFKKLPDDDDPKLVTGSGPEVEVKKSERLKEMSDEDRERLKKQLLDEMIAKRKEGK